MYAEQLTSIGQAADATIEAQALALRNAETERDIAQREAADASTEVTRLDSELGAEQVARKASDQLAAQLRAELAAMNASHRPQVLVPGFTQEVFYDPFTSIDDTKWNVYLGTLGAPREEYCRRENLRVVPEGLAIDARREAFGGRQITSGYIRSDGKAEFGIGHLFEVEATLPPLDVDASGLWAAPLWLRSKKTGEIDGPEAYGFPNVISENTTDPKKPAEAAQMRNSMACTVHNDTAGGPNKVVTAPPGGTIARGSRHRYGILVDDAGVTHYLDGKPIVDSLGRPNPLTWEYLATKGVQRASFDAPMHMRIQLQVGSPYWGPSRPTTKFPATLLIHWARVTRRP